MGKSKQARSDVATGRVAAPLEGVGSGRRRLRVDEAMPLSDHADGEAQEQRIIWRWHSRPRRRRPTR
jgi:hypothetical protein